MAPDHWLLPQVHPLPRAGARAEQVAHLLLDATRHALRAGNVSVHRTNSYLVWAVVRTSQYAEDRTELYAELPTQGG